MSQPLPASAAVSAGPIACQTHSYPQHIVFTLKFCFCTINQVCCSMPHADHKKRVSEKCFLLNVFFNCINNRVRGDAQVNSAAPVGYALAMSVGTYLQTEVRTGGRHLQQSECTRRHCCIEERSPALALLWSCP